MSLWFDQRRIGACLCDQECETNSSCVRRRHQVPYVSSRTSWMSVPLLLMLLLLNPAFFTSAASGGGCNSDGFHIQMSASLNGTSCHPLNMLQDLFDSSRWLVNCDDGSARLLVDTAVFLIPSPDTGDIQQVEQDRVTGAVFLLTNSPSLWKFYFFDDGPTMIKNMTCVSTSLPFGTSIESMYPYADSVLLYFEGGGLTSGGVGLFIMNGTTGVVNVKTPLLLSDRFNATALTGLPPCDWIESYNLDAVDSLNVIVFACTISPLSLVYAYSNTTIYALELNETAPWSTKPRLLLTLPTPGSSSVYYSVDASLITDHLLLVTQFAANQPSAAIIYDLATNQSRTIVSTKSTVNFAFLGRIQALDTAYFSLGAGGLFAMESMSQLNVSATTGEVQMMTLLGGTQCGGPNGHVSLDPSTGDVTVACQQGLLSIDGHTSTTILQDVTACVEIVAMAANDQTGRMYTMCNSGTGALSVWMVAGTVMTSLLSPPIGCIEPYSLTVNQTSGELVFLCVDLMVIAMDPDTGATRRLQDVPQHDDNHLQRLTWADDTIFAGASGGTCENTIPSIGCQMYRYNTTGDGFWDYVPGSGPQELRADLDYWMNSTMLYVVTAQGGEAGQSLFRSWDSVTNVVTWSTEVSTNIYPLLITGSHQLDLMFIVGSSQDPSVPRAIWQGRTSIMAIDYQIGSYTIANQILAMVYDDYQQVLFFMTAQGIYRMPPPTDGSVLVLDDYPAVPQAISYNPSQMLLNGRTSVVTFVNSGSLVSLSIEFRCEAGTDWQGASCEPCRPGFFKPPMSVSLPIDVIPQCMECPSGSIAPFPGSDSCSPCSLGEYDDPTLVEVCSRAPPGRFQNQSLQTVSLPCSPGRYADLPGLSNCLLCAPGSFSSNFSAIICSPCPTASAQSSYGATSCDTCQAGRFASQIGSTICSECAPGSYSSNGTAICPLCPRGSATNETGSSACTDCQVGYEARQPGMLDCLPCPLGWSSGAAGCTECESESYTPAPGSPCVPCTDDTGLICSNGLASVAEGYFAYTVFDASLHQNIFKTVRCPPSMCPGSPLQINQVNSTGGSTNPNLTSITYCEYPRVNSPTNTMCGECLDGYIPNSTGKCVACDGPNVSLILGILAFCFVLVLFLLHSSVRSAGLLSIETFFIQVVILQVGPVSKYLDWWQLANISFFAIPKCIAPLSTLHQTLLTCASPLILTAVMLIVAIIHALLHRAYFPKMSAVDVDGVGGDGVAEIVQAPTSRWLSFLRWCASGFAPARYVGVFVSILVLCFTPVSQALIKVMLCIDVGQEQVLFFTPQVDCRSSEYQSTLPWIYTIFALYIIGLPVFIVAFLWFRREDVDRALEAEARHEGAAAWLLASKAVASGTSSVSAAAQVRPISFSSSQPPAASASSLDSDSLLPEQSISLAYSPPSRALLFSLRYGVLFRMYTGKPAVVWYGLLLVRRLGFVLIAVFIGSDRPLSSTTVYGAYALLGFSSLMAQIWISPFISTRLNRIETIMSTILVYISLVLVMRPPPYDLLTQLLIGLLILPPALVLAIIIIRDHWLVAREGQGGQILVGDETSQGDINRIKIKHLRPRERATSRRLHHPSPLPSSSSAISNSRPDSVFDHHMHRSAGGDSIGIADQHSLSFIDPAEIGLPESSFGSSKDAAVAGSTPPAVVISRSSSFRRVPGLSSAGSPVDELRAGLLRSSSSLQEA